mmetsp:Transcript_25783/g.46521  ORF Transcript_25783/g.46521 Transcript_25783/m.46521 type:complete len:224 (-) Transcript_25783:410-1081(-)
MLSKRWAWTLVEPPLERPLPLSSTLRPGSWSLVPSSMDMSCISSVVLRLFSASLLALACMAIFFSRSVAFLSLALLLLLLFLSLSLSLSLSSLGIATLFPSSSITYLTLFRVDLRSDFLCSPFSRRSLRSPLSPRSLSLLRSRSLLRSFLRRSDPSTDLSRCSDPPAPLRGSFSCGTKLTPPCLRCSELSRSPSFFLPMALIFLNMVDVSIVGEELLRGRVVG